MSGDGYGLPGTTQAPGQATVGNSNAQLPGMTAMASNNTPGATTGGNTATASNAGATPSPTSAPSGLLQADNSTSGFQLAGPSYGTNMMGSPSWADDWAKAGSPDLNSWYQQQQGGYMDMTKPQATPAQLQFAPPPAAPAAAAPAAAAPAAPAQQQGNWYTPKSGTAPTVTKNSLFGSSPVNQAELDALPDAFVASQGFLNQYGSSPSAQAYQQWRMGAPAYFDMQNKQAAIQAQQTGASLYGRTSGY